MSLLIPELIRFNRLDVKENGVGVGVGACEEVGISGAGFQEDWQEIGVTVLTSISFDLVIPFLDSS